MTQRPIGFPQSWLTDQGYVKCVARGCEQVWKTQKEIQGCGRHNHLLNILTEETGPQTKTDHSILLAMNKQRKCPHCSDFTVKGHRSVKDLYKHEFDVHGREDTATISGFVKLLRKGLLEPEIARSAFEPVHQRLLQKIMAWPDYYAPWGLANFWYIRDPDPIVNQWILESMITTPNQKEGQPLYSPMAPDEFLRDLPPQSNERQYLYNWAGMRSRLRQLYANGEI
uniref:Uncharacterized protein n=1 Tax=Cladonia uncialis subsp. uncialis TaxID=180999 RepID=A0A2K9YDZ9_CLAUC|nr:hypothetical protein [Cladonia uncialis subsp. uncialis]